MNGTYIDFLYNDFQQKTEEQKSTKTLEIALIAIIGLAFILKKF